MFRSALAAVAFAALLLTAAPSHAFPPFCDLIPPDADVIDQPPDAPVLIPISYTGVASVCAFDAFVLEVTGPAQEPVAGHTFYAPLLEALVWVPEATLDENATYRVAGSAPTGWSDQLHFDIAVHTRAAALTLPTELSTTDVTFAEHEHAVYERCWTPDCDYGSGSIRYNCGFEWIDAYRYRPRVSLSWTLSGTHDANPCLICELIATSASQTLGTLTTPCAKGQSLMDVPEEAFPLCVEVQATLVGTTAPVWKSSPQCVAEDDYVRLPRRTPDWVDFSACSHPEEYADHPLNKRNHASADSGCQSLPAPTTTGTWLLLFLLGATFLGRTRRRS